MGGSVTSIVLAGGGTAGHVNPLLAVADAITRIEPNAQIGVIGTLSGLEKDLVPQAGYELEAIEKVPFPRRPNAQALQFPAKWMRENRKVKEILQRRGAQVVAGFGGYASAPVYSAAHKLHIPIAVHEQNARAGMANKLASRWADFIGTAFDDTGLRTRGAGRMERVGLPLRPAIAQLCSELTKSRVDARKRAATALGLDPMRPIVVVTGGSLGALSLNRAVSQAAPYVLAQAQVIHLTGRGKIEEVRRTVSESIGESALNDLAPEHAMQGDYHVAEYLERIDLAFACADLVICRSGAGTVCELSALGVSAVYVPLPIGNGEQRFNAQPVVEAGGGMMVDDASFDADWVRTQLPSLLSDTRTLHNMSAQAWKYGIRDAADVMAQRILELV